jgi:hypothetical protein
MLTMSSSRMFWPAGRSLFRKRSRGGMEVVAACLLAGLAVVAVSTWPV